MMATLVVMFTACGGSSSKPGIKGKWEIKSGKVDHEYAFIEFDKDGKFQIINVSERDKDNVDLADDKVRIIHTQL